MKNKSGVWLLLLTAMLWGMSFVAQSSAVGNIGAFAFNSARMFLGAIFLAVVIIIEKKLIPSEKRTGEGKSSKNLVKGGILCGCALCLAVNLQQMGIAAYPDSIASTGRAGFLTATYVVMVAVYMVFSGKKVHPLVLLAVMICLLGMYLLCISEGFSGIYKGDFLMLAAALCFALHILTVDHFSFVDGMSLSCVQFFVCGILSLIGSAFFETSQMRDISSAWIPICYAGIFSSGIGYTGQVIGQKNVNPAAASMILSMEAVFAALGGWFFLQEYLSGREFLGCCFVFAAVMLAQIPELKKGKGDKNV